MKKKVLFFLFCFVFLAVLSINLNLTGAKNGNSTISLSALLNRASADEETGTVYKWSNDIDCPGLWNGDYQVCQVDGYENVCTNPGGRTCNCGSEENNNSDGNCS